MKKLLSIFLCASLLLSLSACTQKDEDLGDKFIMGTDNQYYFKPSTDPMAESESHYYLFGGVHLFSKNKQTGELTVLCNKPDCLHDHESDASRTMFCNAFFPSPDIILMYANNKLYISDNANSGIYEMDVSGSSRKKIFSAKKPITSFMIHRGYMYLAFSDFLEAPNTVGDDLSEYSYYIERLPINKPSSKPEVVFSKSGEFGQINSIYAYGNQVYFTVTQENARKDCIYNLQTKKIVDWPVTPRTYPAIINNQLVYFPLLDPTEFIYEEYADTDAILADLSGNTVGNLAVDFGLLYSNSKYIISDNEFAIRFDTIPLEERAIKIYDKNGKFIKDILLQNDRMSAIGMNEDYFFYSKRAENENDSDEIWAIDLNDSDFKNENFFSYQVPEDSAGGEIYTPFS